MDTAPDTAPAAPGQSRNFLAISILAGALIIGGAILYSNSGTARPGYIAQVAGAPISVAPTADDDVMLGRSDAPVTFIVFGDFQCPYCKAMFDDAEKKLRENEVAAGTLKIVYRDFPLDRIHPFARPAAEAAQCAADEGKYWQFHDYLFAHQEQLPVFANDNFAAVAAELALDTERFNACVTSRAYQGEVQKDLDDGIAAGVTGTPASFVNGTLVSGAQPYEVFKAAIDAALAAARSR